MKILFLNAYFQPEQIAFTHLENDLLAEFSKQGFEVEVIVPVPTRGIDLEVKKKYARIREEALYDGHVNVHRFWAPQEGKNPVIRAFRYFWCNLREYQIGKKYRDVDVVFAPSTPPTQGWIAGKVKKSIKKHGNKQVRFVYNLQDIFPDSLVNAGMATEGSLIWKIGRKIEDKTYKGADKIITISDDFKNNIIDKGVEKEKAVVIPNWVNTDDVYPIERNDNKIIKKYGLDPNKFYICYSGNIGHSQNLELLVDVAKDIQNKNKQIEFVIIGEGAAKIELCELIKSKMVTNIHLLPFQPYEDISHVFSLGDVGLIISKPGIGGSSVPSKTFSIMASGRPILASFDLDSELGRLINSAQCGIVTDAKSKQQFLKAIEYLYSNKCSSMGENGRIYVTTTLNKNSNILGYIKVLKNQTR